MRTKRILSLDDSPERLDYYHQILAEAGYASIVTSDEGEALTFLRTQPVDLLIQDVQRPGMGGWIFLNRMKSDPHLRDIPVLMISVAPRPKTSLDWIEVDIERDLAGYLELPIDEDELLEAARKSLA